MSEICFFEVSYSSDTGKWTNNAGALYRNNAPVVQYSACINRLGKSNTSPQRGMGGQAPHENRKPLSLCLSLTPWRRIGGLNAKLYAFLITSLD